MSKAQVQWHREARAWGVEASSKSDYALYWADTWDEAMFFAQLLADPHEYLRRSREIAWLQGRTAEWLDSLCRSDDGSHMPHGGPNPYREEDQ